MDPGKEFHGAVNLRFPFSFLSFLQADTPLVQPQHDLRAVLGQKTVPNQFSGLKPRSDGLQQVPHLLGHSSHRFVRPLNVLSAFGRLPPGRLPCPVSSQPPGERMLLRSSGCCSVSLSCHGALSCQHAVSPEGLCSDGLIRPAPSLPGTSDLAPSRDVGSAEGFWGPLSAPSLLPLATPPLCPRRGSLSSFGSQLSEARQ